MQPQHVQQQIYPNLNNGHPASNNAYPANQPYGASPHYQQQQQVQQLPVIHQGYSYNVNQPNPQLEKIINLLKGIFALLSGILTVSIVSPGLAPLTSIACLVYAVNHIRARKVTEVAHSTI